MGKVRICSSHCSSLFLGFITYHKQLQQIPGQIFHCYDVLLRTLFQIIRHHITSPSSPSPFTFYSAMAARIAAPTIPAPTWTVFPELLDCVAAAEAEVALPAPVAADEAAVVVAPVVVAPVAVAPEAAELEPDAADPRDEATDATEEATDAADEATEEASDATDEATDEAADAEVEAGVDAPLLPDAVASAQIWLVMSVVATTGLVSSNILSAAHSCKIGWQNRALTKSILCRATALDATSTLRADGVVAGCALAYVVSESTPCC
jgi:hypothetical protein